MRPLIVIGAACFASASFAQSTARPDLADPAVRVPAPVYRSAFEDYRPFAEQAPAPWRELNDEVRRLGGHGGHVPKPPSRKPPQKGQEKK